jgi:hypothetical protein
VLKIGKVCGFAFARDRGDGIFGGGEGGREGEVSFCKFRILGDGHGDDKHFVETYYNVRWIVYGDSCVTASHPGVVRNARLK